MERWYLSTVRIHPTKQFQQLSVRFTVNPWLQWHGIWTKVMGSQALWCPWPRMRERVRLQLCPLTPLSWCFVRPSACITNKVVDSHMLMFEHVAFVYAYVEEEIPFLSHLLSFFLMLNVTQGYLNSLFPMLNNWLYLSALPPSSQYFLKNLYSADLLKEFCPGITAILWFEEMPTQDVLTSEQWH